MFYPEKILHDFIKVRHRSNYLMHKVRPAYDPKTSVLFVIACQKLQFKFKSLI
jgi:hypothetical protein